MIFFLVIFSLIWGSFLNVVSFRITSCVPLGMPRSMCTSCARTLAWYDLIPVVSWLVVRGRCRYCHSALSVLYPVVEVLSAATFTALFMMYSAWQPRLAYGFFCSALICAFRSDFQAMVIPQLFSLGLIPVGILAAVCGAIESTPYQSILGSLLGYSVLYFVAAFFKRIFGKDGLGEGDMELLAGVGSFLGPIGVWATLMAGSLLGVVVGGGYLIATRKGVQTLVPFGPALVLGALCYLFMPGYFHVLLFG